MADAVVIGSGVGGLSAAIALAARGLSVDVIEAADQAGGKLGFATVDGVEFDTGPSVLTLPDALDQVLRMAGTSLADELELTTPSPAFRYLYPDGAQLDVYADPADTLASVAATLGPAAADELASFLAYSCRIWEAAAPHFVYGPAPSPGTLLRGGFGALAALPRIDPLHTMWGAIRRRVGSRHLRWLLARYATYNGSDPRRAPATLNCIAHVELGLGGFGVRGGLYQVTRALVRAAELLGVRIHTGTAVRRVLVSSGAVQGVETADGHRWPARLVVANADAAHVFRDLLPPAARAPGREPEPSMSGWVAVLRARRRHGADRRVAHTVLFPDDYMNEFADIFDRARPPEQPTVYLCAQGVCHDRAGWPDHDPLFVMANSPPLSSYALKRISDGTGAVFPSPLAGEGSGEGGPGAPDSPWRILRETVLDRLDAAGLRDPDDRIVWERTPADLAAQFPGSRGSIYGAASNSAFAAFRRPPNRVRGVRGLYLASGSAHPGGGVPLCVLSGQAAAAAALADRGQGSPSPHRKR